MMQRLPWVQIAFISVLIGLSVHDVRAAKSEPTPIAEAYELAQSDPSAAIELLEAAITNSESRERTRLLAHAGEHHRLNGNAEAAHRWFVELLAHSRGAESAPAQLGIALIDAQHNLDSSTMGLLEGVPKRQVLDSQNADRFLFLAIAAAINGDPSVTDHSEAAIAYAANHPQQLTRIQDRLRSLLNPQAPPADAPPVTPLEHARRAWAAGELDLVTSLTQEIITADPDTREARVASYLQRRVTESTHINPNLIGVLLPLSGKYGAVGTQLTEAIRDGWEYGEGVGELRFVDSGSTPETAVAALEQLVLVDGVIGVIGPVLTNETEAVVDAAMGLEVPLVSLSQALDQPERSSWVLQAMMTHRHQIEALVHHAFEVRQMSSFGIFAPDNDYGHRAAEVFESEVLKLDGAVTITHFYDETATDLLPFAKDLGRKDYEARADEFHALRQEAKAAGRDPRKVVLAPVIDYDALFIPDKARRLPLVCAALAFEEFPIGEFSPTKDGPTIPLLGLSGWNNHNIVHSGGPYMRSGLFTDAFFVSPKRDGLIVGDTGATAFVERFRAQWNRTPSPLEALASDAGLAVAMASHDNHETPAALRDGLLGLELTHTITGIAGFDPETGDVEREIHIFMVTKDALVLAETEPPAPE